MSNLGGRRVLDLDWVESWARRVNEDRVLPVMGVSSAFVLSRDRRHRLSLRGEAED